MNEAELIRVTYAQTVSDAQDHRAHHSKMLVKPPERSAPLPIDQDYPHVNWGQGLMVCGHNSSFHTTRPRFRLEEPATI